MVEPAGTKKGFRTLALVVDQNRTTAGILAALLSFKGFAVMTAQDQFEALETAALIPPELLIVGSTMPGIMGVSLAMAMKNAVPDCKVLLMAGPEWPADLVKWPRPAGLAVMIEFKPVVSADRTPKAFHLFEVQSSCLSPMEMPGSCFQDTAFPTRVGLFPWLQPVGNA